MNRSREFFAAASVVAATTLGGFALNEYKMSGDAQNITEENNKLNECIDNLTEECLKAAGVEIQLTYRDLNFNSGNISVEPSYFMGELQNRKQEPIDPLDKRVTYGAGGMLVGLASYTIGKGFINIARNFFSRRREEELGSDKSKTLQNIS